MGLRGGHCCHWGVMTTFTYPGGGVCVWRGVFILHLNPCASIELSYLHLCASKNILITIIHITLFIRAFLTLSEYRYFTRPSSGIGIEIGTPKTGDVWLNESNIACLWCYLQFYNLGLWWCHSVHEYRRWPQLSDDADDTWLCFWLHILILNYSNPKLIQPTPAAPTCVNTRLPALQHGLVHTAVCPACRIYCWLWLHGFFIPKLVKQCSFNHIILPHCSNFLVNEADLMVKLNQSSFNWGRPVPQGTTVGKPWSQMIYN